MYYLEWEELGGVIVNNRVTEEIIKITFGDNWLIAAFVFVVAVSAIRFIRKNNLPKYFRKCLIVCVCAIAALIDSKFFQWNEYLGALRIRKVFPLLLLTVIVVTIAIFIYSYMKNDKQLKYVIKNTESDGNIIKAWERLQKIKTINLTPWQKRQYDKRRLYLRVMLGNMCGAEQELKKFENDKAFYHFTKAIIFNFRGNHKDELEEEKIAEGYCDGDTDSFLHFQIISNRGADYVGAGEYSLANDWFKRAIDFGRVNNVKAPDLWLNLYYNYVFNKTRLNLDISIQECIDMLEEVKQYIDIEDPKQYIGYRNIVIQLFRQKKADKMQLNEIINQDFEYLVNTNLTDIERCVLEATTARIVCTGRLNPEPVIEKISKDVELFLQLPMPERYRCFKEIDYMFKDLRGRIIEKNQKIKETAHWYIVNQAVYDLEKYRASLPSEAVYEICYCLKERAGLLEYKPDQYQWNEFLKDMRSAQMLYQENGLLADSALCALNIMDEGLAEFNIDSEYKPLYLDTIKISLQEVEKILPELMEHPVLNEIYLRLSMYCFSIDDIERSKHYYESFQRLGNFAIDHFAPWLRGRYAVLSLYMFVIGYIETVDKIARKDLSGEITQIQEWFREFYNRNGYFEAIVLGRMFGGDYLPICVEMKSGKMLQGNIVEAGDIESAWLVIPPLQMKIKCNGMLAGKMLGQGFLFSKWENTELRYCNVNTIVPEVRSAIERIIEMIKAELPDSLVTSAELNRLAKNEI